eukprot:5120032-Pleurochrysis_carterae.AAC.2
MSTSSSKIFPSDCESRRRILSSSSFSCFLSAASDTTRLFFCFSRSGRSSRTTSPSSWSSSPSSVTVKLMIVTLIHTSEAEGVIVVDVRVADADERAAALLVDLLLQHGLQRRVELLSNVFEDHGRPEPNRVLERAQNGRVVALDRARRVLALHHAHPLVGLPLRVDGKRPALAASREDAVLSRVLVDGQPPDVPVADLHRVAHHLDEREGAGHGDGAALALLHPVGDEGAAVGRGEGAAVCDEGGRDEDVADQVGALLAQLLDCRVPADALVRKAGGQLTRTRQTLRRRLRRVLATEEGVVKSAGSD